jgi:hypothetical protein
LLKVNKKSNDSILSDYQNDKISCILVPNKQKKSVLLSTRIKLKLVLNQDNQPKTKEPNYDTSRTPQKAFAIKGQDSMNKYLDKKPLNIGNIQSVQNKPAAEDPRIAGTTAKHPYPLCVQTMI